MRLLVCFFALAGCAAPAPEGPPLDVAATIAEGFSPLEDGKGWSVGDAALFRVDLVEDATTVTQYVRIEVLPPPRDDDGEIDLELKLVRVGYGGGESELLKSGLVPMRVDVYDAEGTPVAASLSGAPEAFLSRGFLRGCEITIGALHAKATDPLYELPPRLRRQYVQSLFSLLSLLEIVRETDALSPILWRVIDKPSALSVLFRGISLSIEGLEEEPERITCDLPAPVGPVPGYSLPLDITLNGRPALRVVLSVCESYPPFLVSGGILTMEGVHPEEDRRLRVDLVSSRRGTGESFPATH